MKTEILINGYLHTFKDMAEAKKAIKKEFHFKIKTLTK